tara:strand:+ start:1580 stop:1837 length:258 start_codon:yes stop_codon:yes gene_type:complete
MTNELDLLIQHHEELLAEHATVQRELNYLIISWRDGLTSIDDDLMISVTTERLDSISQSIADIEYELHECTDEAWNNRMIYGVAR